MKYLDVTLSTPAENLACDEALLEACEADPKTEVLRFWEPRDSFVVLGYANAAREQVKVETCQEAGVPIFRRCSGGGAVVQGPGCLNYTLVLHLDQHPPLSDLTQTNRYIMETHRSILASLVDAPVAVQGITDLTLGAFKFSGNAQRRKRRALLFHGTFLLSFDLALIERLLPLPTHQPAYRAQRSHLDFLTNLKLPASTLKTALQERWQADEFYPAVPRDRLTELVQEKYGRAEWNLKR